MKKKWTKEKCREVALKCKSRTEFYEKYPSAYVACCLPKNKWLPELCSHMEQRVRRPYIWTKEKCREDALKCKYRNEFKEKYKGAYTACHTNKWLDEVCSHMELRRQPIGYWTKERCKEAALEYKNRGEFSKKYPGAYTACRKNKWSDEVCNHMEQKVRGPYKWTKENCKQAALKCKSRSDFEKKYSGAYRVCYKNKWLDEVCIHMEQKIKPSNYWDNIENCKQAALECKTRTEFSKKYKGAYSACRRNKWLDELCSHMNK